MNLSVTPYRPWGLIHWMTGKLDVARWDFLGCLSTEERSLAAWSFMQDNMKLGKHHFWRIDDAPGYDHDGLVESRLKERAAFYDNRGGDYSKIPSFPLLRPSDHVALEVEKVLKESGNSLVVDITSMPKAYFFPAIRMLFQDNRIENLVVTYTVPESYSDQDLSEDHQPWDTIKPFVRPDNSQSKTLVIGVGFEYGGVAVDADADLRDYQQCKLIFPLPSAPAGYSRTLEFVRHVGSKIGKDKMEMKRVSSHDVCDAFNIIKAITTDNPDGVVFAPYAPKPVSLAMCIFATLYKSEVRYTQPRSYNPDYSTGIRKTSTGYLECYAYCIKLHGRHLYA